VVESRRRVSRNDRVVTEPLLERARRLLTANTREAVVDGRRYLYTIPSPHRYRFQWHWDSCFHAIVWAAIDRERAREELRSLVARQTPAGLLPHIVYWEPEPIGRAGAPWLESSGVPGRRPRASAQLQPPLAAQALEAVVADDDDPFLHELLPAVERFYRYLAAARDPDRDALISIFSQFESGLDFSPLFDPVPGERDPSPRRLRARARAIQALNRLCDQRPALVLRVSPWQWEDVLVNSAYVDGLDSLARLAARAGDAGLAAWAAGRSRAALGALLERCFDERRGLFFSFAGRRGRRIEVKTVVSLLPLLAEGLPAEVAARLAGHLADPREFGSRFPVPSVALDEPSFVPGCLVRGRRCIWRGPCSINTNWLLCLGLRRHGFAEQADGLAGACRELVERGGFNEFYDPLAGTPVGTPDFGWATLAALL
jgi:Mannosylglycerate hydrolase MGH1-like glycoside hydrolase domain